MSKPAASSSAVTRSIPNNFSAPNNTSIVATVQTQIARTMGMSDEAIEDSRRLLAEMRIN